MAPSGGEPNLNQNLTSNTQGAGSTPPPVAPSSAPVSPASAQNVATPNTQNSGPAASTNPDYAFPSAGSPETLANESVEDPLTDSNTSDAPMTPQQNVDPLASTSPATNTPEYIPDVKPKKKLLKILIPILVLVILLIAGGFFYIKTQRTSAASLKEFSLATSNLSSEASTLSEETPVAFLSSRENNLEEDVKSFDEALANFESKVKLIKSDKKALKSTAENYVNELKNYRQTNISLAVDASKVSAITYRLGLVISGVVTGSNGTSAEYSSALSKLVTEIDTHVADLKELSLTNNLAIEYRDSSVELANKLKEVLIQVKAGVDSNDSSVILDAIDSLRELSAKSNAIGKEKEIGEILGVNGENTKKVEAARDALNNEIDKVNKSR